MTERPDNVVRLIAGGLEGKLLTGTGAALPVRVFERGGGELMLVLMLADDAERVTSVMSLEYTSARGLVRFRGELELADRDLVRFHVHSEPQVLQRREFVRVEAVQQVVLANENGELTIDTHAIEISGGGMLLSGPHSLELDAKVRFSLHLDPEDAPILGAARVVRAAGAGQRALMFDQITSSDRQRLIHYIFERQRAALARGTQPPPVELKRRRR
jgi:c-di-GMP-binding flagellar brake protein YcgR